MRDSFAGDEIIVIVGLLLLLALLATAVYFDVSAKPYDTKCADKYEHTLEFKNMLYECTTFSELDTKSSCTRKIMRLKCPLKEKTE